MIADAADEREVNDYVFIKLAMTYDLDGMHLMVMKQ
jgi:hypothetical protein